MTFKLQINYAKIYNDDYMMPLFTIYLYVMNMQFKCHLSFITKLTYFCSFKGNFIRLRWPLLVVFDPLVFHSPRESKKRFQFQ